MELKVRHAEMENFFLSLLNDQGRDFFSFLFLFLGGGQRMQGRGTERGIQGSSSRRALKEQNRTQLED